MGIRFQRLGATVGTVIAVAAAAIVIPATSAVATPRPPVIVFPRSGSVTADAATEISFRGVAAPSIGAVTVSGSASGTHGGTWSAHSDGNGASFHPATPFTEGERVTVHTSLAVAPTGAPDATFTVAHRGARLPLAADDDEAPAPGTGGVHAAEATRTFASRPDLTPPVMTVTGTGPTAPGYVLTTTNAATQSGPLMSDDNGEPVFYKPVTTAGDSALDFEMQTYKGKPVLTWWEGISFGGFGNGKWVIVDTHYNQIATVKMRAPYDTDHHEMQISPQNTAIVMSYNPLTLDLTAQGGPSSFLARELVVQEIDIATGDTLMEWHSLDDVPLAKSVTAFPTSDYIHGNAAAFDTDGNVLVSGRNTSSIYKINRTTGALMWTLGKNGNFTADGFTDWFWNQHDVRRRADGTLSVFDNATGTGRAARGLAMNVDEVNKKVSIAYTVGAATGLPASRTGSFRGLPGGHNIVGWGNNPRWTEFDASGAAVRDGAYPTGVESYRAIRADWHATPTAPPDALISRAGTTVDAKVSWNGATEVRKWVVMAGPDTGHLHSVAARGRAGFETELHGVTSEPVVAVEARDSNDKPLGRSKFEAGGADHNSYWLARTDGRVQGVGQAGTLGGVAVPPGHPVTGMAAASNNGYWLTDRAGAVYAYGNARSYGSLAGKKLRAPIVGIAAAPDGAGYWLVASDGGVFTFGTARYSGSMGGTRLKASVVGIAARPDGSGYWLVAADGGIFTFGHAGYYGSTGNRRLKAAIVGISANTSDSRGYWMVASDGGIFTFGSAPYRGSTGGRALPAPIAGMASTSDGSGYWLAGRDGAIYNFGTAPNRGSRIAGGAPVVAIAHD